jgi:gliding motility-associated-like protein
MNKILFCFLLAITLHGKATGQENLIPNPSFEDISDCSELQQTSSVGLGLFWYAVLVTPDLFHVCARGVPVNRANCYQPALDGSGYAGINTYLTTQRTTEYFGTKLLKTLKKGNVYFIRFYASPRNCGDYAVCYSDAMGLAFSETRYQEERIFGAEQIPPFKTAIQNPVGNILKDTVNWTEISGCYTANGTEQYAILGSFRTSANTKSEGCIGGTGSYHYIDNVGVFEFDPLPDTLMLCKGESRRIGQSFLNGTYRWSTGATDSTIVVTKGGINTVSITVGGCTLSDTTMVIEMEKALASLPTDTLICQGDTLHLNIPISGAFIWSNGGNTNHATISTAGTYAVNIVNDCGVFDHNFEVTSKVCDCPVYVPNSFSPNGDGLNDYLECYVGCDFPYQSVRFQVLDRWGGLMYTNTAADSRTIQWDGTFKGQPLDVGVYVWSFEYEYTRNGMLEKKIITGDVTIIK